MVSGQGELWMPSQDVNISAIAHPWWVIEFEYLPKRIEGPTSKLWRVVEGTCSETASSNLTRESASSNTETFAYTFIERELSKTKHNVGWMEPNLQVHIHRVELTIRPSDAQFCKILVVRFNKLQLLQKWMFEVWWNNYFITKSRLAKMVKFPSFCSESLGAWHEGSNDLRDREQVPTLRSLSDWTSSILERNADYEITSLVLFLVNRSSISLPQVHD